jgi:Tfp pilus assembly protein PilX
MNTRRSREQGVTIVVVLVLLVVMLLGGLALARMTEVGSLAAGNAAYREASMQASEIGLNTVYKEVRDIVAADENSNDGGWYWAQTQAQDAAGLPAIDWNAAPEIVVGAYRVRYVAERMCTTAAVTDPLKQCLVKQIPQLTSADASRERPDPPNSRQFRVTVRVVGPKDTTTFVQSLLTKG